MVMLVHLAPAKLEARIRRNGLKPGENLFGVKGEPDLYAFPVLESHTLTHQWTRELMKWRRQPMIGVYFRVADDEPVRFGHYFRGWVPMLAAQAAAAIRAEADPRGFQIILGRGVKPKDISRIAPVRGVIGWRHKPDAHGKKPCGCPACMARGEPGGAKIRKAWERDEREADEAWAREAPAREARAREANARADDLEPET